jgi:hypothetical protein
MLHLEILEVEGYPYPAQVGPASQPEEEDQRNPGDAAALATTFRPP